MGSHRTRLPHRVRCRVGKSLREFLRLLLDFANTFGTLRRRLQRLECHTKESRERAERDSPHLNCS